MLIAFAIIAGLMIGSFLNVCIHRMPIEESVITPRSHCVQCKNTIPWYDNIPIISYLILSGRCRFCKSKISFRYFIVELLTAFVFVLLVNKFGRSGKTLIYIALSIGMIIATFVDLQHQIIPDEITYGGMVLGLLSSILYPQLHSTYHRLYALRSSFIGLIAGGLLIYAVSWLGTIAFRKKLKQIGEESAMGGGDVKYLAMIGSFLGLQGVLMVFFLAPFFGVIAGISEKLRKKSDIIPYGPYLSLATLVVVLWGDIITRVFFPYI
jgi:leader peptidase (prepilin peptidase) / N-methyltransferase